MKAFHRFARRILLQEALALPYMFPCTTSHAESSHIPVHELMIVDLVVGSSGVKYVLPN